MPLPAIENALETIATFPIDDTCVSFDAIVGDDGVARAWRDEPCHPIGFSREGRPLYGLAMGRGDHPVSIIAGCHADEPVGPMSALAWPAIVRTSFPDLLEACRFCIIPQMNPDGARRNAAWYADPPDFESYWSRVIRELPGDDVEFGFGDGAAVRPECVAAETFLQDHAPYVAHFSLHGLALGRGAWFLIDPVWRDRAEPLMDALAAVTSRTGVPLHDEPRDGAKGFIRIREGFCTTPNSVAMKTFFMERNDPEMAERFHPSSMEFIRALGGDPLCAVSEMPLFLYDGPDDGQFDGFKAALKSSRSDEANAPALADIRNAFPVRALPIKTQMRMQVALIVLAVIHRLHVGAAQ